MNKFFIIILALILPFMGGCASYYKKQNEALRRGIHGTNEAISKGRYDVAKKISEETVKLVPPSKKPIVISEFKVPESSKVIKLDGSSEPLSGAVVVLPEGVDSTKVISFNSSNYNKLVSENLDLKKSEENIQKSLAVYGKEVNKVLDLKEKELEKEKKSSWWGWIFGFGTIGTIILIIVGCVFFPALIPMIGNIFSKLIQGVNFLIQFVSNLFKKRPG